MPRPRVLSFGFFGDKPKSPEIGPSPTSPTSTPYSPTNHARKLTVDTFSPQASSSNLNEITRNSPSPSPALQQRNRAESRASRPTSMIHTLSPSNMDLTGDTLPELQPIFSFLNSHSNKLYQEGYFLKLHDLDSRGRPSTDRTWTECFAQLVGTVLSLWDAAALDAAGEEGEVLPTFINLSDASIKMIESLPMNGSSGASLQNVLSISTAANNRYLLHFNSLNSLTQWTAGIRLAMYEHATLQEAYTGSLIAGKGKLLNNIKPIMERSRFKVEDWARVRFGAGTPWRRCWCVISPPDEKEWAKAQKVMKKKNSYERKIVTPKGDIKFYDTRRITKKTQPLATISDAFAAYAIYPQSKPLIDQSTLVKLEGLITIHSTPEATTEGFIFVMPEVHPAVTGFEMMLRWLFPVWDTFALYGRPSRLIADTLDQRGIMFAMPKDRRYGYLDTLDVSGLIHTEGSQAWSERQWRSELKKLTSHRMNTVDSDTGTPLRSRRNTTSRNSLPGMVSRSGVRFDDDQASQSSPVSRKGSPAPPYTHDGQTNGKALPTPPPSNGVSPSSPHGHSRSVSDVPYKRYQTETPSRLSIDSNRPDQELPPQPPSHGVPLHARRGAPTLERLDSEQEQPPAQAFEELQLKTARLPLTPVATPPTFMHPPSAKPVAQPYQAPELRRATSGMDAATLHQMQEAIHPPAHLASQQYPQHNGQPHEVAIDAQKSSSVPADMSIRKELVNQHAPLPTIPASPSASDVYLQDQVKNASPPPLPPKHVSPSRDAGKVERKPLPRDHSAQSTHLEATRDHPGTSVSPALSSTSSVDAPAGQLLDDHALEQILSNDGAAVQNRALDNGSLDHSSHRSSPSRIAEKPRAGRLKTVGDINATQTPEHSLDRGQRPEHIPQVDFGPTYSYKPAGFSTTQPSQSASNLSAGQLDSTPRTTSPGQRNSYFAGRGSASSSVKSPIDSAGPYEQQARSVAWLPTRSTAAQDGTKQTLTPEEWVQHRASMASQPIALRSSPNLMAEAVDPQKRRDSHKRHSSTGPSPASSRHTSGEWSQQIRSSPPPRPSSQNANVQLYGSTPRGNQQTTKSPTVNAREQMHVARATGSPLIDLDKTNSRKQPQTDPNAGLYGALQAREREKAAIREGYRSNAVQQAIASKQQQQQQLYQYQQQQTRQMELQHLQAQQQMQQASFAARAAQAAQAAQMAQHQRQQSAYTTANVGQQQMQYPPQMQAPLQQYGGQRPYQQNNMQGSVAGWNPVMTQQQAQQGARTSMYGDYPASINTRPSPR